jgi:hypothetical protein
MKDDDPLEDDDGVGACVVEDGGGVTRATDDDIAYLECNGCFVSLPYFSILGTARRLTPSIKTRRGSLPRRDQGTSIWKFLT